MAQVQFSGSSIDSITYLTGDQIGSPRLGTDDSQQVVWRWDSDAFGSVEPATDPDGDGAHVNVENRFAGQYADGESGLRYNWNRYYDPVKGRYVTSDPIGLAGGVNSYGYVGGNPVGFYDLTGRVPQAPSPHGSQVVTLNVKFASDLIKKLEKPYARGFGVPAIIAAVGSAIILPLVEQGVIPPEAPPYNPTDPNAHDPSYDLFADDPYGPPSDQPSPYYPYNDGVLPEILPEGELPEKLPPC
ncbi:MAG: RHS repeat-associated core domain-containing protein [Gammaproteobacteria bacterium]|nr:RHS repeat-associated core domain-containing protein [Gammaproteobacteria bacterium]